MAGALKELQSEGKADQVFHLISASNGTIEREKDVQPVIKVTTLSSWDGYLFNLIIFICFGSYIHICTL